MKFNCDAVVFDCDGVLFDSNALKTQAFREVLAAYPESAVEPFLTYHQQQGGVSRYVKLRTFFTDFLQTPVPEDTLQTLLQDFGAACQRLYQQADLTPGCFTLLETLATLLPLYVASGSDEVELRQVFLQRGLAGFFKSIYGSPKTKLECAKEIIREVGDNARMVFVGDAVSDWRTAQTTGMRFVFMSRFSEARAILQETAAIEHFPVIETLTELLPLFIDAEAIDAEAIDAEAAIAFDPLS